MKKTILTATIISALLVGCNETKSKENHSETMHTEKSHDKHGDEVAVMGNSWTNDIKLDKGSKWDANLETTESVMKMTSIIANNPTKIVEDYHSLSTELNEVKNYLVKNCTMEGASHDNLHVFLHPLIEKIGALGKVTNVEEGEKIKNSIKENLDAYSKFFQ